MEGHGGYSCFKGDISSCPRQLGRSRAFLPLDSTLIDAWYVLACLDILTREEAGKRLT